MCVIRLLEYESKTIFKNFDLPVLEGTLISRTDDIALRLEKITFPAIIKSQIAIGSRKKAGLIKIAQNQKEGMDICKEFFQKEVSGYKVEAILIENIISIEHEYYVSISLDASGRQFFLLASKEGGTDIEEVAKVSPEKIIRINFNLSNGLTELIARQVSEELGFNGISRDQATDFFLKMWKIAIENDATLVEVNPLALTLKGLIALDGKMELDENAAVRNPVIKDFQLMKETEVEKDAKQHNLFLVELDGDVGIIGNGAGLTLELMDILYEMGVKPANFLDLGGGAKPERVYKALELIISLNPKVILINIFGGITRCDFVAQGILQAFNNLKNPPPLVIRFMGTKHLEGIELLNRENVNAYEDVFEAVSKIKDMLSKE